jgi:hypothetical protein
VTGSKAKNHDETQTGQISSEELLPAGCVRRTVGLSVARRRRPGAGVALLPIPMLLGMIAVEITAWAVG